MIHECAVLTVAHGPRSELVMGDRVHLPGLKGVSDSERIFRVRRIIDHPKAGRGHGFDVRLLMLQFDEGQWGNEKGSVRGQLAQRAFDLRNCATLEAHDEFRDLRIAGFSDSSGESQGKNGHRRKWREVTYSSKDQEPAIHGHDAEREYVFKACECDVSKQEQGRCIAFGDSGSPVFMGKAEENKLVAMYVRRSINEPVSANPHLVALRLNKGLIDWLDAIRQRYAP
ncbi:MAG: trypsin-like serine protease [Verrucomicrobiae bacterium]|nr:trypsin-like serine protease [Verrucomicrobiae bacterium]